MIKHLRVSKVKKCQEWGRGILRGLRFSLAEEKMAVYCCIDIMILKESHSVYSCKKNNPP